MKLSACLALAVVAAALTAAVPAGAATPGGHLFDVGIAPYFQDTNKGGAKAEARFNLAPDDPNAALYVIGGLGVGKWSDKTGSVLAYLNSAENYTKWTTTQRTWSDLGLGFTYGIYTVSGGLMVVSYDTDIEKKLDGTVYTGSKDGSRWGGWFQAGWEYGIGHWLVDLMAGYRQTRDVLSVDVKSASGATKVAQFRPVRGLYLSAALRYRI